MAEIEIGVLSRQCLSKYIESKERMIAEVAAWERQRNKTNAMVNGQFSTADARVKLKNFTQ